MAASKSERGESGPQTRGRNLIGSIIGAGISAALLYLVVKNIEWESFVSQLGRLQPLYVLLLIALYFVSFYCRAVRWRYLLPSEIPLSTRKLFEASLIGFFATCVLPLRAGEFVRPWALSRWQPVSFSTGFASIVTERVFDVLTLLLVLGLCLSELESAPDFVSQGAKLLALVAFAILGAMILAYLNEQLLLRMVRRVVLFMLGKRFPLAADRIILMVQEFILGLRAVSSLRELFLVLFWSLALWGVMIVIYQVGLWAFGEFPSFLVGTTVTALIALAVAAPSAPGFLGTFQFGCVAALSTIHGYPKEFALAYSVVLHAFQVVLAVLGGVIILRSEGLSLADLRRSGGKSG